jgi:hypothetical protein
VRYVLITEDVVNGKIEPLYFGRDGKDQFHETILKEETEYSERTGKNDGSRIRTNSVKDAREREAYGGIP